MGIAHASTFKAKLVVEGVEKFHNLSGKVILVFNHKSHLDFVFNFFALSSTHLANGRSIRPRYMAAKDHFVDNKFVYSGLGVGKLIESVDSVFVDRKGKGKEAILDACRKLGQKEIEIAMYPQGTRALWNSGPNGERWDAGYYTTGTVRSLKREMGHMKKGCAFLAIDTAMAVQDRQMPVHLVMIGIEGTGTLIPKGSLQVQTEGTIKFTVGDILTLTSQDVAGLEKPDSEKMDPLLMSPSQKSYSDLSENLQKRINKGLVTALGLHEKLKNRFFEDVRNRNLILKDQILILNHHINQYQQCQQFKRDESDLPFVILDLIYALPPKEQGARLKDFADALLNQSELTALRDQIVDQVFQHRGSELKSIQLQEQSQKLQKAAASK
ncbi:MAG: 1-acyl-sn-glycerol-3-phosphate acyltransferase [Deltaproteobacteria bacterium]|nr:MAG: 1-acyl-sn-glycerol-3-phosphate acyltransferase [Deltaproteobacteria bacterium]